MKFLIDFSWFYYKCIHYYNNNNIKFTYSTDLNIQNLQSINKIIFNTFKDICNTFDYFDKLTEKENNFHNIGINERKLIGLIFKKFGKNKNWINQNIIDCDYIFQIKIKDNKRRLFFILDKDNKVIKPLFIDLNHLIYVYPKFKNNFINCLICFKKTVECKKLNR